MKDIAVSELQFAFSVYIMIDARLLADWWAIDKWLMAKW